MTLQQISADEESGPRNFYGTIWLDPGVYDRIIDHTSYYKFTIGLQLQYTISSQNRQSINQSILMCHKQEALTSRTTRNGKYSL